MAWVLLISAGLLETGFAVSLEQGKKVDPSAMGRRARTCCPPARGQRWAGPDHPCLTAEMSNEMLTLSPTSTLPLPSA
jgi:hypothetical protein